MKTLKPETLDGIRHRIATTKQEITLVKSACLPVEDVISGIRSQLGEAMEGFKRIQARVAECIRSGFVDPIDHLLMGHHFDKNEQSTVAFGGALSAYGLDRFMDEVITQAGESSGFRLSASDREAKLKDLFQVLYELELAEEIVVEKTGAIRRADCNVAAVYGVPYEVALPAGLVGE